jgi:hypothetical protein
MQSLPRAICLRTRHILRRRTERTSTRSAGSLGFVAPHLFARKPNRRSFDFAALRPG